MSEMKMEGPAAPAAATAPIRATGTVAAVNAAQGTITLNHEPIPAIQWSAMTMEFKAEDPRILQGVAVGDRVAFELKSVSETNTVTMVQKQ
jgi:Cu(I)/Ag(I) efflux system protein CusF